MCTHVFYQNCSKRTWWSLFLGSGESAAKHRVRLSHSQAGGYRWLLGGGSKWELQLVGCRKCKICISWLAYHGEPCVTWMVQALIFGSPQSCFSLPPCSSRRSCMQNWPWAQHWASVAAPPASAAKQMTNSPCHCTISSQIYIKVQRAAIIITKQKDPTTMKGSCFYTWLKDLQGFSFGAIKFSSMAFQSPQN